MNDDADPRDLAVDDDATASDGPEWGDHAAASDGTTERAPLSGRWLRIAPWIVALLAVAVAVVATVQWQTLASAERAAEAVERAAGEFAVALTNWDAAGGGMLETREQLRASGTDRFGTDVDELFGPTDDLGSLAELGARSEGELRDVFVQSISEDRAEVLAVVLQRVVTDVTEGTEVSLRFAQVRLVDQDGTWLVDEVELLVDSLRESAVRTDEGGQVPDQDPAP